jgi:hypothetical protein
MIGCCEPTLSPRSRAGIVAVDGSVTRAKGGAKPTTGRAADSTARNPANRVPNQQKTYIWQRFSNDKNF